MDKITTILLGILAAIILASLSLQYEASQWLN